MRLNYIRDKSGLCGISRRHRTCYTRISARALIDANTYKTEGYLQEETNPCPKTLFLHRSKNSSCHHQDPAPSRTPKPFKTPPFLGLTLCIPAQLERGGCTVLCLRHTLYPGYLGEDSKYTRKYTKRGQPLLHPQMQMHEPEHKQKTPHSTVSPME